MLRIKGFTVLNAFECLRVKFGAERLPALLARLPAASREFFEKPPHKDRFIEIDVYLDLLRAAVDEFYGGDVRGAEEIGNLEMAAAFRGIYRFFVRVGPNIMARIGALYWRQVYDSGRLELMENGSRRIVFRLHLDEPPDRLFCGEVLGSFAAGVEISGGKLDSSEQTVCAADGYPYCEFKLTLAEKK